jgi:hypothetical protein
MPFTPAHPAIILPFVNRKYFSTTGLIIGSISPDFEYFFKASVSGVHGHTLPGIFYFDLPVTVFLALTFHLSVKQSLIPNLPQFLQKRLQPLRQLDFKHFIKQHYFISIYSVILGAASHIFWDGFTHNGKFFVEYLPIYKGTYVPFQGVKYPLWYALQHISTAVGGIIIIFYVACLPIQSTQEFMPPRISYWIVLILLASVFFTLRFMLFTVTFNLGNAVVTSISALLLSICLISLTPYFKTGH